VVAKKLVALFLSISVMTATAGETPQPDENFMLVLREFQGTPKQQFSFEPSGASTGTLPSGEKVVMNLAWFDLIGDMHVRFVMDGERTMRNVTAEEFASFGLTPEQAVEIAVSNIRKRYGTPQINAWSDGIMMVTGESPDLDSSYFLDRAFWDSLLKDHRDGVIVGVPKRGGLIYAPVSDRRAVAALEQSIHSLFESSESMRVSSALYKFKDGNWTVYRQPEP
jgi:uncharacterized protein YtpQ (UPF0354 family)